MALSATTCTGNGEDHCCYFKGKACPELEENTVPGRRWACGLYRKTGDWDNVIASDRYKEAVQPLWDSIPALKGMNCRDWPQNYPSVMAKGRGLCCHGVNNG